METKYKLGDVPTVAEPERFQLVNNAKAVSLIPIWAIHVRVELDVPCGSLLPQNIL